MAYLVKCNHEAKEAKRRALEEGMSACLRIALQISFHLLSEWGVDAPPANGLESPCPDDI